MLDINEQNKKKILPNWVEIDQDTGVWNQIMTIKCSKYVNQYLREYPHRAINS